MPATIAVRETSSGTNDARIRGRAPAPSEGRAPTERRSSRIRNATTHSIPNSPSAGMPSGRDSGGQHDAQRAAGNAVH
jgi:hypothetical protein